MRWQRSRRLSLSMFMFGLVVPWWWFHPTYVPSWWEKGWPRCRVDSIAEAELLSQLAVILMPDMPIKELFRSFPSPEGWGGNSLAPDLAVHGVLKEKNAALFIEYDGYWRHGEKKGIEMDQKKNVALLAYAPDGSYVVRICHEANRPLADHILCVNVDSWRQGDKASILRALKNILTQISTQLEHALLPCVGKHLQLQVSQSMGTLSKIGQRFVQEAASRAGKNTTEEIMMFLVHKGFSVTDIQRIRTDTRLAGQSVEWNLEPKLQWLLDLGLSQMQVAKAVATHPQILGYSIEQNLKLTVVWLLDLGLSKKQVAKAVATFPQILGYSTEQNLKPTVEWLLDLGLSKQQVAKAVATFPQILGH